jgi:oligopeptide transport system permease protein
MLTYSLRRAGAAVPTLFILVTLAFILIRLGPGGPFDTERQLPAAVEANLEQKYHLQEPLFQQYTDYLWGIAHGDFGPSFQYPDVTVTQLICAGFPVSFKLGASAMLLALTTGITLGLIAAVRQNRVTDYGVMMLAMLGISIPNFVLAPLLILCLAVYFDWLPAGGSERWQDYILPVITLAAVQIAYIARLTRGAMIEVLRSSFIRTARAKGLSMHIVLFRHALPAALAPVVSYVGPATAGIITGSVVVEAIFGLPGLGHHFVNGALNRDYTLVLGIVLFYGMLVILLNLIVDLLYAWLDPRIKY